MNQDFKADAGKWQTLIPKECYEDFVNKTGSVYIDLAMEYMEYFGLKLSDVFSRIEKVLEFGAKKYEPHSWQRVEPYRYYYSLRRHEREIYGGEDKESGLPHLDHFFCNCMFLHWFEYYDN